MTASLKATECYSLSALSMLAFLAETSITLSDLKHSQETQRLQSQENFVWLTPHPPGLCLCLSLSNLQILFPE